MRFEFDLAKSRTNKGKHGIDFVEAQMLWSDDRLILAAARRSDEPRFMAIGRIGERHWSAICVWRGDAVRLISVRRSRKREIDLYESH